jgi:hypothetical protein
VETGAPCLTYELRTAITTERVGTIKRTIVLSRACILKKREQQQGQPFHGAMQTELDSGVKQPVVWEADCTMSISSILLRTSLQLTFCSVRSCGLRTDKSRQSRNAATVV